MTPIQPFQLPLVPPSVAHAPSAAPPAGQTPFKEILLAGLGQVNSLQQEADAAVQQLAAGGDVDPTEVLTTLQKAELSFQLMLQIRNQLVQAYQEVSNIRI
ncbi:MAG: flagellar hook-basal body complex protein FliE [Planctomycetaceae bacterium]|nr:flagellar hook-basal body complex protein FliE [Planctomycetaceae bacterium]